MFKNVKYVEVKGQGGKRAKEKVKEEVGERKYSNFSLTHSTLLP